MARATYPPVPSTARLDLIQTLGDEYEGIEMMFSVYVRNTIVTRNGTYLNNLALAAEASWGTNLAESLPNDAVLTLIRVTDLNTTVRPSVDLVVNVPGLTNTPPVPATVCAVVSFTGTFGNLPKKSYIRFGPLVEAAVEGNFITDSFTAELSTNFLAFMGDVLDTNDTWVIVSVFQPGAGDSVNRFRDSGITNAVGSAPVVRRRVGRSVSRLS